MHDWSHRLTGQPVASPACSRKACLQQHKKETGDAHDDRRSSIQNSRTGCLSTEAPITSDRPGFSASVHRWARRRPWRQQRPHRSWSFAVGNVEIARAPNVTNRVPRPHPFDAYVPWRERVMVRLDLYYTGSTIRIAAADGGEQIQSNQAHYQIPGPDVGARVHKSERSRDGLGPLVAWVSS